MFFGMVLETFGIGLVIPALGVMTNTDLVEKYPKASSLLVVLGYPDQSRLVSSAVLILVSVYAIKTAFLTFLAWHQSVFIYSLQEHLSKSMFAHYLRQPFAFHLRRNSAQLIRNATIEVINLAAAAQSIVAILTETLVLVGITFLLLLVEPLGVALVAITLGLISFAYYFLTRERVLKLGVARQHHEGMRIQHLQQGLGGVREIKLFGREDDFLRYYHVHNFGSVAANQRYTFMQQLPRLWLEFLAIIGLAILVLVMMNQGKSVESLVPTLGLFAAAAFRLMPSVNRIIGSSHSIRFAVPTINTVYEELKAQSPSVNDVMQPSVIKLQNQLQLHRVGYRYPETNTDALADVCLTIQRGKTIGFIGGSGAGKSTLVDVILGLLSPTSGTVFVDDIDVQTNVRGWQNHVGYVPQSIFLIDDTLLRNVAFGLPDEQVDFDKVKRAISVAQLEDFIATLPDGLNTVVGERGVRLSGGQRQRIGIARALYHDPSVLVLDEATSSLDKDTENEVMKAIIALHGQKTILIVAHRLSTVAQCDWIYRLDNGRIIEQGKPANILSDPMLSIRGLT